MLGEPSIALSKNVLFSSIVWSESNTESVIDNLDDFHIILKVADTPSFPVDYYMYLFLNSICDTFIFSGKLLRDEDPITQQGDPWFPNENMENFYYY